MSVLSIRNVSLAFGGPPLLADASLEVAEGERVCLVGRNGSGKSSLLKVIHGDVSPDAGEFSRQRDTPVSLLPQEVPADAGGTVFDVVASGLGQLGELVADYHHLSERLSGSGAGEGTAEGDDAAGREALLHELGELQDRLDAAGAWEREQVVETVISRLKLDAEMPYTALSGGLKRRALLGRALASNPGILLLDEPTNHLDFESIQWLEEFLLRQVKTLLFVTHDRAFIRRLATRVVELDRGVLTNWACDYDTYLERKAAALEEEAHRRAVFDKKLAKEEAWIRQGIKARRTRNEGRVRALLRMREARAGRREVTGQASIEAQASGRSGQRVVRTKGATFAYPGGDRPVIEALELDLVRGDKIGLIGANGSGKTTLLRLLLGELEPTAGTVKHGTRLEVAYYDQLRAALDPAKTVAENIAENSDAVTVNGGRKHVISYLEDFLFTPDRARSPVSMLSGGERNRLLLAKLFTRPANVLVLDEPTNDLDAETLELLEAELVNYPGTVLLVSHDREFLDNVVSAVLYLPGDGRVIECAGGFSDWQAVRRRELAAAEAARAAARKQPPQSGARAAGGAGAPAKEGTVSSRLLSRHEREELAGMPGRIEALEEEQADLHRRMADPATYRDGGSEAAAAKARCEAVEAELEAAYARWEELESVAAR